MINLLIYLKPFAITIVAVATFIYTIYLIRKDKLLETQMDEHEKFRIKTKKKLAELSKDHINLEKVLENVLKNPIDNYAHLEGLSDKVLEKAEKQWADYYLKLRGEIDQLLADHALAINEAMENFEGRQLKFEELMENFSNPNNYKTHDRNYKENE